MQVEHLQRCVLHSGTSGHDTQAREASVLRTQLQGPPGPGTVAPSYPCARTRHGSHPAPPGDSPTAFLGSPPFFLLSCSYTQQSRPMSYWKVSPGASSCPATITAGSRPQSLPLSELKGCTRQCPASSRLNRSSVVTSTRPLPPLSHTVPTELRISSSSKFFHLWEKNCSRPAVQRQQGLVLFIAAVSRTRPSVG